METMPPPRSASRLDLGVASAGRLDLGAEKARAEVTMKSMCDGEVLPTPRSEVAIRSVTIGGRVTSAGFVTNPTPLPAWLADKRSVGGAVFSG